MPVPALVLICINAVFRDGRVLDLLSVFTMLTRRRVAEAVVLGSILPSVTAAPPGFPDSGNGLWFNKPGRSEAWSNDWLPIGNGFLAGEQNAS